MRHASLFSGIGGFDLAAEWMGWTNVFKCEWEDFPRKVLKHHFPNAIQYGDIRELDATKYRGRIDIITGGFPCQPYSTAGKRLGKDDERHLWPEMLRIICEVQPRYVVGENVRGLISWNDGLVFDEVQADLEAERYEVLPFVLPACAVNAPHRRDRVWFVAHANDAGAEQSLRNNRNGAQSDQGREKQPFVEFGQSGGGVAYSNNEWSKSKAGPERQECERKGSKVRSVSQSVGEQRNATNAGGKRPESEQTHRELEGQRFRQLGESRKHWQNFPTQPPVCGGNDGLSRELDGITFSKWRNESIKAYGNAIVPQVALQIFKAIQETDRHD